MQPLDEALLMLADRGEDLPTETLIARLEAELGAAVVAPEESSPGRDGVADEGPWRRGTGRRRVVRPAVVVALAVAVAVVLVTGVAWLLDLGGDGPADVPPVSTTTVDRGIDTMLQVTFDGVRCTVEGPDTLPAGTIVPLVLTNTSGDWAQAHIARLLEGHIATGEERTFEDFVELQAANGGVLMEDPSDLIDSPMNWLMIEPVSFNRDAYWPTRTLDDDQTLTVHRLSNQLGTRIVYVSREGPFDPEFRINPGAYWFCAPLGVTPIEF